MGSPEFVVQSAYVSWSKDPNSVGSRGELESRYIARSNSGVYRDQGSFFRGVLFNLILRI